MNTLTLEQFPTATATELVAALARREVSAEALCETAIAGIEQLDAKLNAVVVRDFERAREAARGADEALAAGDRRPLLGLPMTVKESFDVEGLPTTWGVESARDHRASADSVCVARLRSAGAVILGKTNVSVMLGDWQAVNPIYGRTLHPLDPARTPGGSSGGSAAALAAGMVPLELGSDIGGSIRVPSNFCGVYGHNPSYGLVPPRGHTPAGADGAPVDLGVVGPMARSVADLTLALHVLAGPDEEQAVAYRLSLPPPRRSQLAGSRLLVLDQHPSVATAAELRSALQRLATELGSAGAHVSRATPLLPDLAAAHRSYVKLLMSITTRGQPIARTVTADSVRDLLDERERLRRSWRALFREFDAVLAPSFGTFAFPHVDEESWRARKLRIDDADTPYGAQLAWPGVATFPGLPATALPIGETKDGLPLGIQVIGPYLEDLTPLELASLIQRLPTAKSR
jgi:amidase